MRISDWSSDVCSSDLGSFVGFAPANDPQIVVLVMLDEPKPIWGGSTAGPTFNTIAEFALRHLGVAPQGNAEKAAEVKIGRESCRESVCQYVSISVVAVSLKKKANRNKEAQESI